MTDTVDPSTVSSPEPTPELPSFAKETLPISLEKEMRQSYLILEYLVPL